MHYIEIKFNAAALKMQYFTKVNKFQWFFARCGSQHTILFMVSFKCNMNLRNKKLFIPKLYVIKTHGKKNAKLTWNMGVSFKKTGNRDDCSAFMVATSSLVQVHFVFQRIAVTITEYSTGFLKWIPAHFWCSCLNCHKSKQHTWATQTAAAWMCVRFLFYNMKTAGGNSRCIYV